MKIRRYKAEKLVRDRTIERLNKNNVMANYSILDNDNDYLHRLIEKLDEEAREVKESASSEERLSELADVLEVIYAICKASGKTLADLEKERADKFAERGGFEKRIFCHYVEGSEDSPTIVKFYKPHPEKYPEIEIPND
jgi:predicted house-cleaning noncanonical NTP pyrophosphatase (MazG superfamily)